MTRDLLLPDNPEAVAWAERAERLGYDGIWLGELWGRDAVVPLARIAERTDDIDLGSAILNVYSRTPAVLAMTAASLQSASEGRFRLGVGTSTRKVTEDLHGMEFDRPVRRAHETIELTTRFLTADERVSYDGEVFETTDFPSLDTDVPIFHAALGRANRRVVARLADGWLPHIIPFPDLDAAFDYIVAETPEGRDASDITVAPYVPAAVSDDPAAAEDAIRGHVAYYVGSGDGYRQAVAVRFPEEAERVATAWRDGRRKTAIAEVTDEMVGALGVAGTPETARTQFEAVAALPVVDRPIVTVPRNAPDLRESTVNALAPTA